MMATGSSKFPTWFNIFVLVSLLSAFLSTAQVNNGGHPCVNSTYEHEGRTCCLCGAGLYVQHHCTTNLQYGKCMECGPNTYNSQPTNQETCEPCTSCTQASANLEVEESCTPARDTKCRCQKDHFCSSGIKPCPICQPCKKCGDEGVKVHCTAKNNTVCNDPSEGGENTGLIVGIIFGVLFIIGLAVLAYFYWKKRSRRSYVTNEDGHDEVSDPINVPDADLHPHLYEIAEAIGWEDMCMVATRSKVPDTVIKNCERNNPHDTQQQTVELLKEWAERQGRQAPGKLIRILQARGRQAKAEKVRDILSSPVTPV